MTDKELADFRAEQAAFQRRLRLMREQGKINRQESRLMTLWVIAGILTVAALVMAASA